MKIVRKVKGKCGRKRKSVIHKKSTSQKILKSAYIRYEENLFKIL